MGRKVIEVSVDSIHIPREGRITPRMMERLKKQLEAQGQIEPFMALRLERLDKWAVYNWPDTGLVEAAAALGWDTLLLSVRDE
mgnify:CR=1 FL=1